MSQQLKQQVAEAAMRYVENDIVLGVGTGSTVNCFIDVLGQSGRDIEAAVSSSEESTRRLQALGIRVIDANAAGPLALYIDGADEIDPHLRLIKGGGGALTREKIIAEASERFICIADASKQVSVLGNFPLPVEVVPMARSLVARELSKMGGQPEWREDFVTDNGNWILDVRNLDLVDPLRMEREINQIPGVVTVGIFARRPADVALIASTNGVDTLSR
ncbi:MAG: ribose-5-phosphate isomerase RpiA [Wenzhouxiangellaceae bacterium]